MTWSHGALMRADPIYPLPFPFSLLFFGIFKNLNGLTVAFLKHIIKLINQTEIESVAHLNLAPNC